MDRGKLILVELSFQPDDCMPGVIIHAFYYDGIESIGSVPHHHVFHHMVLHPLLCHPGIQAVFIDPETAPQEMVLSHQ